MAGSAGDAGMVAKVARVSHFQHARDPTAARRGRVDANQPEIVAALRAIVPGEGVIDDLDGMRPYECDALSAYRQMPLVVVLPEPVAQVQAILRLAAEMNVKIVPRGAGTSLSGGALPREDGILVGMGVANTIQQYCWTRALSLGPTAAVSPFYYMSLVWAMLLGFLVFLGAAEMALSRMTKPRASSLAEKEGRRGRALKRLVDEPQKWVNPLLLMINICQIVQATLTSVVADRLFGTAGVAIGVVLNVVVFFVVTEAVPKTYAVLYPQKAALFAARPVAALVAFPPLRWVSKWLISLTNVIVRGKGLEQGPFVNEQELLGIVEVAAEDEVIE